MKKYSITKANTLVTELIKNEFKVNSFFKEKESSQINNLIFHLNSLEQSEHIKHKIRRRKEITKGKFQINEIENSKTIKKINKIET